MLNCCLRVEEEPKTEGALSLPLTPNQREAQHVRQPHVQSVEVCAREMIRIMLDGDIVDLDHLIGRARFDSTVVAADQSLSKGETDAASNNPERCV